MKIGYARTSTTEQEAGLAAQIEQLKAAGCERVYAEQVSATAMKRPELEKALDRADRPGDEFIVTKPDRLARSVADLLTIESRLRASGVRLRVLSMDLDTTSPTGKLTLQVLGAVAEFERELMLERQREGIAKAKAEGKYEGRAPTARAKGDEVRRLHSEGVGASEIAKQLGIGRTSVYRALGGS